MSKRILGIDIRSSGVTAVLTSVTLKGARVEAHYRTPVEKSGEAALGALAKAVTKLSQAGDFTGCECVIAIPAEDFFFRNLWMPFREKKKIAQILPFELEPSLPVAIENLLFDFQIIPPATSGAGGENSPILAVALDKIRLEEYLKLLKNGHFNPAAVAVGGMTTALCLAKNEGLSSDWGFVDLEPGAASVFFFSGGRLLLARSIAARLDGDEASRSEGLSKLCREIRRTLLAADDALFPGFAPRELRVAGSALNDETDLPAISEHLNIPARGTGLSGHAAVTMDGTLRDGWDARTMDHALALTLAESAGVRSFNFRKGPHIIGKFWSENRGSIISAGITAGLAVLLFLTNTFIDIYGLEKKEKELTRRVTGIFREALPNEPIVKVVEQMQLKIKEAGEETALPGQGTSRIRQIDILNDISRLISKDLDVEITRLTVAPDSVMISGSAGTYDGVNEITGSLEKSDLFKQVAIGTATSDARSGRVRFKLNVEL